MAISKEIEKAIGAVLRLAIHPIPCSIVAFAWWYTRLNGAIAMAWFLSYVPPKSLVVPYDAPRSEYFYFILLLLSPFASVALRRKRREYITMQRIGQNIQREALKLVPPELPEAAAKTEKSRQMKAANAAMAAATEGAKLTQDATKRLREML